MPTWSEILTELNKSTNGGKNPPALDFIRRKYLTQLYGHTKRNVIIYATKFTQPDPELPMQLTSIVDEDIQGLMEVIHSLDGPSLDFILHSPGGSPEAAEGLVKYLRSKFSDIRIIVPHLAQSAATMIACSADKIMMGKHSSLGPTDPQIQVRIGSGFQFVPAQAITAQFDLAVTECQNPRKLAAWMPMLAQYGPHLLTVCANATHLTRSLVEEWLAVYMFRGEPDAKQKAESIAIWLCEHSNFRTHGRHLSRDELAQKGLKIDHLETDQKLQDLVLSVFHSTTHTFEQTGAVKIIENHLGKAFIKQYARMLVQKADAAGSGKKTQLPLPSDLLPPGTLK